MDSSNPLELWVYSLGLKVISKLREFKKWLEFNVGVVEAVSSASNAIYSFSLFFYHCYDQFGLWFQFGLVLKFSLLKFRI